MNISLRKIVILRKDKINKSFNKGQPINYELLKDKIMQSLVWCWHTAHSINI